MTELFVYGRLAHLPFLARILRRAQVAPGQSAILEGFAAFDDGAGLAPLVAAVPGATLPGALIAGLDDDALAALDFHQACYGLAPHQMSVRAGGGLRTARTYLPELRAGIAGDPWDTGAWARDWAALSILAADEVMAAFGTHPPQVIAGRLPTIRARAAARVNARDHVPVTLRHAAGPGDVEILNYDQPYTDFFAIGDFRLRHRRFDGTMSEPMDRAAFLAADSATVLPYDPLRDRVLLIEQFRVGPMARGDAQCWLLEAIAGRLDPGESPETTVRREALEEAGLELGALHKVQGYYPSPGAQAEYITSFIGIADLPSRDTRLGGLADEHEDIRSHVVDFDRLMALLDSGELDNAPLILSVMWLAMNRDRLRAGA
ncbi:NUDIX domain-containing protein [Actibacterium ureilyticum]|uniref:NUDIX domain-containing protein n=1 Tax=Actibacterium ureilyticum TaxID=1590614 RepID=UPI000BAAAEF4|nr:NUDIX domain-containing protein [Actibacterium ureilyticum]